MPNCWECKVVQTLEDNIDVPQRIKKNISYNPVISVYDILFWQSNKFKQGILNNQEVPYLMLKNDVTDLIYFQG